MLGKAGKLDDVCNDEFVMEPKYDGFRMVVNVRSREAVECWIGRNSALTENLPYIERALLEAIPEKTILDGELYSPELGWSHTSGVVKRKKPHDLDTHGPALKFAIFDVIGWGGVDQRDFPFSQRRELLEAKIPKGLLTAPGTVLRRSPTMPSTPETYAEMIDLGFEGVMAKRLTGVYRSGKRSTDLIKIKMQHTVDVVVKAIYPGEPGSWIADENLPGKLGFGYHGEDESGLVGTGFKKVDREDIRDHPERWLGRVIEVGHMTVDKGNALRHPAFIRRRDDKKPEQAVRQDA